MFIPGPGHRTTPLPAPGKRLPTSYRGEVQGTHLSDVVPLCSPVPAQTPSRPPQPTAFQLSSRRWSSLGKTAGHPQLSGLARVRPTAATGTAQHWAADGTTVRSRESGHAAQRTHTGLADPGLRSDFPKACTIQMWGWDISWDAAGCPVFPISLLGNKLGNLSKPVSEDSGDSGPDSRS